MGGEMGGVTGRMRGTVVRGEDIERVLAIVPEQLWLFDADVPSGVTASSTVDVGVEVPMARRREIIATVLGIMLDAGS